MSDKISPAQEPAQNAAASSDTDAQAREYAQDYYNNQSRRWWLAPMGYATIGVAALVGSIALYHNYFAPKPMRLAVLDINYIVEAKEMQFTALIAKPGVTEADRKQAMDLVAGVEPELKRILAEVRQECGCEILVKAAALTSGHIPDITKNVAERMKIDEASVLAAKLQIRQSLSTPAAATPATGTKP